LNKWRRQYLAGNFPLQIMEVFMVVSICAMLTFGVPFLFSCRPTIGIKYLGDVCDNENVNATLPNQLFCVSVCIF